MNFTGTETELKTQIQKWLRNDASKLQNAIVFLEGEMGAGKSTFARLLLSELVADFSSQGSPTFPLVQTYQAKAGHSIYHIDLYRLKNENELEDSGILHQIEEPKSLALVEWPNLFEDAFSFWKKPNRMHTKNVYELKIETLAETRRYFLRSI